MTGGRTPARLRAARVLRPHGVRGEVRVEPLGGDAGRFKRGLRLHVERASTSGSAAPSTLVVQSSRAAGEHVLLGFAELDSSEAAAGLRGAYLCVDADQARALPGREWFVWQVVGMRAVGSDGAELGRVADVEEGVASDVLVLDTGAGVARVPMVEAFVEGVDLERRIVHLHPWEEG